ncbi:RodZ domain-containing protein [Pseudomarimonas arenosa]|uniref:Helix-turn-helix domain-containing protein n=1 Tax=Pseudomarimonas arenosa TaxID=2774145 RepID=A0AAW3ZJ97_9GAMM|nr:RodZ domain-containing protein [Pseudomarimonas arenosa]MBD8525294.1 helix-turn-helix domain-containing protein [Pseudomarimonas arenosa]
MSQPEAGVDQQISLGKQLRTAREDRGDSLLVAAQALKLPTSIIESMEQDQFARLGAPVYARGHLRAYLRWLGLPESLAEQLVAPSDEGPSLQPSMRISRSRAWVERNALRAVYAVLTASILVPALWVATERSGLDPWRNGRSLDEAAPSAQVPAALPVAAPTSEHASTTPAAADSEAPLPVMASMTPFGGSKTEQGPSAATVADTDGWTFHFIGDSWVEIEGPNGRLEYGLLREGETRQFAANELSRVALGNVHAVELHFDGEPVALDSVTRANVARFTVSSAGEISGDPR